MDVERSQTTLTKGMNLRVDGARLWDSLMEMAQIGPGVAGGNNRQTLTDADAAAAPLVVWEGSHTTLRAAFTVAFDRRPAAQWPDVDLTEIYQSTRRSVFETCPRRELPLRRGEAVLVHRHALHGIAPWTGAPEGNSDGRTIAYFRPVFTDPLDWIVRP